MVFKLFPVLYKMTVDIEPYPGMGYQDALILAMKKESFFPVKRISNTHFFIKNKCE